MDSSHNMFIVAVGLPARGKSYLFKRLQSYLSFLSYNTRLFNLGDYRREMSKQDFSANYFTADNSDGKNEREKFAQCAMNDAKEFINSSKERVVALYDGTNTTLERRNWIRDQLATVDAVIVWIEMVSNDDEAIANNVKCSKIKTTDYDNVEDDEQAYKDFCLRIEEYKKVYVPCDVSEIRDTDREWLFIVEDFGKNVVVFSGVCVSAIEYSILYTYLSKIYSHSIVFKDIADVDQTKDVPSDTYIAVQKGSDGHTISKEHERQEITYTDNEDLVTKLAGIQNLPATVYIDAEVRRKFDEFA